MRNEEKVYRQGEYRQSIYVFGQKQWNLTGHGRYIKKDLLKKS